MEESIQDISAEEVHWLVTKTFRSWLAQSYSECDEVCDALEAEQQRLKRLSHAKEQAPLAQSPNAHTTCTHCMHTLHAHCTHTACTPQAHCAHTAWTLHAHTARTRARHTARHTWLSHAVELEQEQELSTMHYAMHYVMHYAMHCVMQELSKMRAHVGHLRRRVHWVYQVRTLCA